MAVQQRTICIIGAGIAGLSLALALAKFGVNVTVLEKATKVQEHGAGLQISPNARHILNDWGLESALNQAAFCPQAIDIYPFKRSKPLVSLTLGARATQQFGARYDVMHRADLANLLFRACRRFANIDLQFNISSFDFEVHSKGLSLLIQDETGQSRNLRCDGLIGADGVHSLVRTNILGLSPATFTGMTALRTMIPLEALKDHLNLDRTNVFWGPGFHAVLYPIPTRGQANVALFTKSKKDEIGENRQVEALQFPKAMDASDQFNLITQSAVDGWTHWPLCAASPAQWHKGPIGLIGDAAHAMLPFQAQGAAMAIEDAAVLAPLLAHESSVESALATYQAARKPRTTKVAAISKKNGNIFHAAPPVSWARNIVVKLDGPLGHFKRLDWIYSYRPPSNSD